MSKKFVLFVNTTDSFSDCWDPFFKLFETYWPDYKGEIYLNTENKIYKYRELNIISVCNGKNIWSDSVATALHSINEEYILYLQDDYFLKDYVKTSELYHFFNIMLENDFDCLHLTDQCSCGPFLYTEFDNIIKFSQKSSYKINCQAAIWKREVLLEYLIPGESGWDFELYGTRRSHYLNHDIYCLSRSLIKLNEFEIIPYIFTGIVKGKWLIEVVDLFSLNKIYINYADRGFYTPPQKKNIYKRIMLKFKILPHYLYNEYLVCKIRISDFIRNFK